MNNREKNKYEMFCAVTLFYDNESASLNSLPAAGTAFSGLKLIHKEIALYEKVISEGTKGKVVSKDISQEEIIKTGLVITGAIYGYAANQNDAELMTLADISSRTFSRMRDSEIPIIVDKIIAKAEELGDALVPYGITAEKRSAARAKLDQYIERFGSLTTGKVTKKTAYETIQMLFEKADKKLRVLDKLMIGFRETDTELYQKYIAARSIYDKAAGRGGAENRSVSPARANAVQQ